MKLYALIDVFVVAVHQKSKDASSQENDDKNADYKNLPRALGLQ
jgi:hypothetical protein